MNLATYLKATLLLALVMSAVGCGMSEQDVDAKLQPLMKDNQALRSELASTLQNVKTENEKLRGTAQGTLDSAQTYVQGRIEQLDKKYEEYNRAAQTFKHLTDDIKTLRDEQMNVYKNLAESLDGMRRLFKYDQSRVRSRQEILTFIIQILDKNIGHLEELTGAGSGSGGNGGGSASDGNGNE